MSYKTLNALEEAHHKHCKTLTKELADSKKHFDKVCKMQLQMIKDNNEHHFERISRYAKLYIAYKRKYESLFFLSKNKRISQFTSQSVSSLFSQYFLVTAV